MSTSGALPLRTKFAYGVGQVAETVKTRGFDLLVFFFFTQVLGLSGTLAGAAVFIALVFDAVTDPFVGVVSDHWRSPRGRRHPFMYAAALPLGVSWVILFLAPPDSSQWGLFAWLTGWAIVVRGSMTLYHVPHLALGAELTDDYQERTSVVAWRSACALLGAGMVFVVGIRVFFPESAEFENGMLNPSGYPRIAVFSGTIMALVVWYSAFGTRDRVALLAKAPEAPPSGGYLGELRAAVSNQSFVALFLGFSLFGVSIGTMQTLTAHMNVFFWGFDTEQISLLVIPLLIGFVPGIIVTRALHARFDKRPTMIVAVIGSTSLVFAPVAAGLLGVIDLDGTGALFALVFTTTTLYAVAAGIAVTTAGSMMADVAQEHEYQTGRSLQGVLFAAMSFSGKTASGIGHLFAGVGLDWIAFPLGSAPSEVSWSQVLSLGSLFLAGGVGGVFGIVSMFFYRLDRRRYEETLARIKERRAETVPRT